MPTSKELCLIEMESALFFCKMPLICPFQELLKCKTNDDVKQVGLEWGIKQSQELLKNNVPVLHYYTMGKGIAVKNIVKEVF